MLGGFSVFKDTVQQPGPLSAHTKPLCKVEKRYPFLQANTAMPAACGASGGWAGLQPFTWVLVPQEGSSKLSPPPHHHQPITPFWSGRPFLGKLASEASQLVSQSLLVKTKQKQKTHTFDNSFILRA